MKCGTWSSRIQADIDADYRFWVGSPKAKWRTPLLCLVSPAILLVVTEWLAVSPWGAKWLVAVSSVVTMPATLAVVGIFVAPCFLLSRKHRRSAVFALVCSVTCVVGFTVGAVAGSQIRRAAFIGLAERGKPLVEAVKTYERNHGRPPESLNSLVPDYLPAIPSTRMGAYPAYEYASGDRARRFETNPWVIYVVTPSGGINFDQFLYFPLQNYPKKGFGGWLERIGEWAYVHE